MVGLGTGNGPLKLAVLACHRPLAATKAGTYARSPPEGFLASRRLSQFADGTRPPFGRRLNVRH